MTHRLQRFDPRCSHRAFHGVDWIHDTANDFHVTRTQRCPCAGTSRRENRSQLPRSARHPSSQTLDASARPIPSRIGSTPSPGISPRSTRLKRLQLTQERIDLEEELERLQSDNDLEELERAFTEVAKSYAERKGISYSAFRELGVSAKTLKAAGIARSS
ncbi:MAG: hypothetical protein R2710_03815 [Acidimicrobiales bacterium]